MSVAKPTSLNKLAKLISEWAAEKGFWDKPVATGEAVEWIDNHQKSTKISLMHSELGEMLEAVRKPRQSEKIPQYTEEVEELADLIIRALDYAGHYNIDIAGAVAAKMEHNGTRPHKHGKKF